MDEKVRESLRLLKSVDNTTTNHYRNWKLKKALSLSNVTCSGDLSLDDGILCDLNDIDDIENKIYLDKDPGNIILMTESLLNPTEFAATGINIKNFVVDINTQIFYDCARDAQGNYIIDDTGHAAEFPTKGSKKYFKCLILD
jgi:hypothetical protein